MSVYLAFDTSTEFCSVALLNNGQLVQSAGIQLADIDGVLFGHGPGSFTGLRIACGIAQGLSFGLDKPVLGVSTLKSIAFHFRDQAKRIAVLNDARMNECYAAI